MGSFPPLLWIKEGKERKKKEKKNNPILAAWLQRNVYSRLDSELRVVLILILNSLVMEKLHIIVKNNLVNFSTCRTLFLIICQAEWKIYYAEYAKMAKSFSRCRATEQLFYGTEFTGSSALWPYSATQMKH